MRFPYVVFEAKHVPASGENKSITVLYNKLFDVKFDVDVGKLFYL